MPLNSYSGKVKINKSKEPVLVVARHSATTYKIAGYINMDNSQHNASVYNQSVAAYMNKFMDLALYKDTFDPLLNRLPLGATVLELGCGPGNVVKYLKSKRADLQILGIDLAPEMIEAAKKENPDSMFRVLDIRHAGEIEGHFDAVIAAFCIPYLGDDDLPELFAQMSRLTTAKKGLVYLSFMEGERERSGFEKTSFTGASKLYINYYPRTMIASLLLTHGFVIRQCDTKDYLETDGSVTTDLIYIAESCNAG